MATSNFTGLESPDDSEFMERLMFRDLLDTKVDVRATCQRCEGRGVRNGNKCEVCDGDKVIIQSKTLYSLAKDMLPFFVYKIKEALIAESQRAGAAGA
jgi:hypothetical protein